MECTLVYMGFSQIAVSLRFCTLCQQHRCQLRAAHYVKTCPIFTNLARILTASIPYINIYEVSSPKQGSHIYENKRIFRDFWNEHRCDFFSSCVQIQEDTKCFSKKLRHHLIMQTSMKVALPLTSKWWNHDFHAIGCIAQIKWYPLQQTPCSHYPLHEINSNFPGGFNLAALIVCFLVCSEDFS